MNRERQMSKVLIVDDNQEILDFIESCIEDVVTNLIKAFDGESALLAFRENKPDLVITDYSMPRLNGLQLAECIEKERPECPVILVSGFEKIDGLELSLFAEVFQKPFSIKKFKQTVVRLLAEKNS